MSRAHTGDELIKAYLRGRSAVPVPADLLATIIERVRGSSPNDRLGASSRRDQSATEQALTERKKARGPKH